MTIAPELPGALELVDGLLARGVTVSLGHSNADAACANDAFDRGIRTVTHLFNVMRPFGHRDPGVAGAALARDDVAVQLICDGTHLADETVLRRLADRTGTTGDRERRDRSGGAGRRPLHARQTSRCPSKVACREPADWGARGRDRHRPGSGSGGSARLGVPLAEAVDAGTRVPARILGRGDVGVLGPGARADVAVLDDDLCVRRVLRAGIAVG